MADLLGEDFALAEKNTLYRCHDRLLEHKKALFAHLTKALERSVQHPLRGTAIRSDEHLFRV